MDIQKFKEQPLIRKIKDIPRWTISKDKVPLDMHILFEQDQIKGAHFHDQRSLCTLDAIDDYFAQFNQKVTNHAFFLDTILDNIMVLDVEPSCPDEIKKELLQTNYIYGEISLSGKGYHLVFDTPSCFMDYPDAYSKPSLKHKDKYYEILMNQFCTFTGNVIPLCNNPTKSFDDIYKELASKAKTYQVHDVDIQSIDEKPDTEYADKILEMLKIAANDYKKQPSDFKKEKDQSQNDYSRYEWAYISYLNWKLSSILAVQCIANEHEYTDSEKAYFLYTIACEMLPHREKHDTYRYTRDNKRLPWLGYLVQNVMEKSNSDDKKKNNQSDEEA